MIIPLGVVDCELATEEGGRKDSPEIDGASELEDDCAGVSCSASIPVDAELTDDFLLAMLALLDLSCGCSKVTTLTPTAVLLVAGMNREVALCLFTIVLVGWKLAQHEALVSPVE